MKPKKIPKKQVGYRIHPDQIAMLEELSKILDKPMSVILEDLIADRYKRARH